MKMKVSDYIAKQLAARGLSQVFTVTGGGAMHLNGALGHEEGLHCLCQHHEQACAMAAESYVRIHNQSAVLCVTTGPDGINTITGVTSGWLDSIPTLVLSGQVRYDTTARWSSVGIRTMGDQEFDIVKVIGCMTKYSGMMTDPTGIWYCLEKAIYLTTSGRPDPAWLDIPLNVQGTFIKTEELEGFDSAAFEAGEESQGLPAPVTEETARAIIEKIRDAKRPVTNAGNGIRIVGAYPVFTRVMKMLGVPVATGWNSQDCMCSEDELYVGRAGNMGDRPGNFAIQNNNLVFSARSRLNIRQVGYNYKTRARAAYTIVNDIDIEELKKPSVHVDMMVHADARDLLEVLEWVLLQEQKTDGDVLSAFKGGEGLPGMNWLETYQMWKKKYPVMLPRHMEVGDDKPANMHALVQELSSRLEEGQITMVGNGFACVAGGHGWIIKPGQRFIFSSAIVSMGYDLPAATGACMADSSQDTALLTGDGSTQMSIQELQTIIHHRTPIKIFLINNGGYHSIRQAQKNYFGEPLMGIGVDSHDLSFSDMEKLAGAYGYPYVRVCHDSELAEAVEMTLAMDGPVIYEVLISMEQSFEPRSAAKRLPDGTMVSPPLEDLSPFLPEEEMDMNMTIPRTKQMSKIVVTGATSFLGTPTMRKLLSGNHRIFAMACPGSKNQGTLREVEEEYGARAETADEGKAADAGPEGEKASLHVIEEGLSQLDRVHQQVKVPCEIWIHLGWDGADSKNRTKSELQRKNILDTLKAFEGARQLGCKRFLYSSSQVEYGVCQSLISEDIVCHPVSKYGKAKVEAGVRAAKLCERWRVGGVWDIESIHVRAFSIYGTGDHPWLLVNTCLDTLLRGGHMELGACTQQWNFLYIDDLVDGVLSLVFCEHLKETEDAGRGIYNTAGDVEATMSLRNYVEATYEPYGKRGNLTYRVLPVNAEGPANPIPDVRKPKEVTGWWPKVSFEEGIRRMIVKKQKSL